MTMNSLNWYKYWYIDKTLENIFLWFIWKIPRKVCLWCFIRVASSTKKAPCELTYESMYNDWIK